MWGRQAKACPQVAAGAPRTAPRGRGDQDPAMVPVGRTPCHASLRDGAHHTPGNPLAPPLGNRGICGTLAARDLRRRGDLSEEEATALGRIAARGRHRTPPLPTSKGVVSSSPASIVLSAPCLPVVSFPSNPPQPSHDPCPQPSATCSKSTRRCADPRGSVRWDPCHLHPDSPSRSQWVGVWPFLFVARQTDRPPRFGRFRGVSTVLC